MKVTITEYRDLATDGAGHAMPLGTNRIATQTQAAAGAFSALNASTRFIRIATDTAITIDIDGGATDELFPAGVEYMAVNGGEVLTTTVV